MFLSRKAFIGPLPNFQIERKSIEVTNNHKCLGLSIDSSLSWQLHTRKLSKDFNVKVKKLFLMRFMNQHNLSNIYFKGILPSVLYCIGIWGNCEPSLLKDIENIHIKAARFICKIKKTVPDTEVIKLCKWKSITWYYKRRVACITYNLYNENLPPPLLSLIKKRFVRSTRRKNQIEQPNFKTKRYKSSFRYRASLIWNNIPDEIKEKSYDAFKIELKRNEKLLDSILIGTITSGKALDEAFIYY